jgi:hypothetical protein
MAHGAAHGHLLAETEGLFKCEVSPFNVCVLLAFVHVVHVAGMRITPVLQRYAYVPNTKLEP